MVVLGVIIHPRKGTETGQSAGSPFFDAGYNSPPQGDGNQTDSTSCCTSFLRVIIHPRKGTETVAGSLTESKESKTSYNSPPQGDGNLAFPRASSFWEVIIHPRKGTETRNKGISSLSSTCYNSPPQGDGNNIPIFFFVKLLL